MRHWLCCGLALLLASCATAPSPHPSTQAPSWPTLSRFSSEAEFLDYLRAVRDAQHASRDAAHGFSKQSTQEICPPEDPSCMDAEAEQSVVVTASSRSAAAPVTANAATTNVQTAGVDEGDIVKMIGRFLIVLQDGRLFSIDTGAASTDLALVDRIDIYTPGNDDAWYDEILVHENRILATSYNYELSATEFTVFSLSAFGRFTREGSYYISSNDYYDGDNYATRLVNGNLVIYTPLDVSYADVDSEKPQWPLVRRWLRDDEDEGPQATRGHPLFDARDIYRPIQSTNEPMIHTISVCPLGSPSAGDELECRSTAIAGTSPREFYVSNDHIYLWLWQDYDWWARGAYADQCLARPKNAFETAGPGALFQIDLDTGRPRAMFVRGGPVNQLGMEATADEFHALAVWVDPRCNDNTDELPLRFLSTPLSAFSTTPRAAPASAFTPVPSAGGRGLENRFTTGHLVYGGRQRWHSYVDDEADLTGRVVVVPTDNPNAAHVLQAPHNIIRVEAIGEDAVITGYRNRAALSISVLDLSGAPRISDTALLEGRFETEGRSHAFNAMIEADGSGILGLPTGQAQWRSGRWYWDSESSDVSFLALSAAGTLNSLGALETHADTADPSYECEVSCIDWYGNSRPIFVNGRIFALSGTELIEGRVGAQSIEEIARVNLTTPVQRPR
jgi:hypothetical protein